MNLRPVASSTAVRGALASVAAVVLTAALVALPGTATGAVDTTHGGSTNGSTDGHRADAGSDERSALPRLRGRVGPDDTITINDRRVPAGTYRLKVRDLADDHNFHIFGDGVDKRTRVGAETEVVWRVQLQRGVYTIQCDPHSGFMRLELTVT